jgi:hypothetical protein
MSKGKKSDLISLNINEVKDFLKHIIDNNRYLQKDNKPPVSIEVQGESGIGKTSSILQLATEMDLSFVKLNLAQIEELGDLVGFPIRQFEMRKHDEDGNVTSQWIDEHAFDEYTHLGYKSTGGNRMSYCPPEWIAGKSNGGILLLDDWNRADVRFIQAVMELIDRQQYISWELPKDWHIILTSNPDNGDYLVNSIDNAQKTRFISVNLMFDAKCWAKWAEESRIDGRCINFLLLHPELVTKNINSRSITMFFNSISSIKEFEKQLPLIQMIGEGSVGPEFSTLFTTFINNKLDKIISPEDIFNKDEKYVLSTMGTIIGKDAKYRADIAATIATRMVNYLANYSKDNPIAKDTIQRIENIVNDKLFASDICYNLVKGIYNSNPNKFKPMMQNNQLVNYILK